MDRLLATGLLFHLLAASGLAGVLHPGAPPVQGRVEPGAVVQLVEPAAFISHLQSQFRARQEEVIAAEAAVEQARTAWRQKTARRDEAARVLRVAEQSNATDVALCRTRLEQAAAEAEEAFGRLELSMAEREKLGDPLPLLASLPGDGVVAVGTEGEFSLPPANGAARILLVRTPTVTWLKLLPPEESGLLGFPAEEQLTSAGLRALLSDDRAP
jgi:hypothetical protein